MYVSIDVSCGPLHLNWKPDTILDIKNYFIIIDNQLEKITKEKKTNNNNNNNINDNDNNNSSLEKSRLKKRVSKSSISF